MVASTRWTIESSSLIASATTALTLASFGNFQEVAEQVLADLGAWMQVDRCIIGVQPPAQSVIRVEYLWVRDGCDPPSVDQTVVEVDASMWGWEELAAGRAIRLDDIGSLLGESDSSHELLETQGVGAVLAVPLIVGGTLHGTLTAEVVGDSHQWTDEEEYVTRTIANVLWTARTALVSTAELEAVIDRLRVANRGLAQANATLESANRAKNEFLSMASHELRTPLTAVIGFGETLQLHWEELSEERRRQAFDAMMRHSHRLDELVTDILRTTRIAADLESPRPRQVEVGPVLESIAPTDAGTAVSGEANAWVDEVHLKRILENLMSNAKRYGRPPYRLHVGTDGRRVQIVIRDHGPGVPEDFAPVMFERFTQGSTGDRRVAAGTGLGLAIVRDLAHLNEGEVRYERARPGARFIVDLPAAPS